MTTNTGIILLNWNQADDTITAVHTLLEYLPADYHIWVVDNASQPTDIAHLHTLEPAVTLLYSAENKGFAGGNNLAITAALAAGCQQILLLNNDATIAAADLQQLQQVLREHPDIGIAGPSLWDSQQPDRLLSAGGGDIGTAVTSHLQMAPAAGELRDVTYVPGTCMLIRRAVFEHVGLLHEAYFFGGEVADLCMAAQQHGFRCVIVGGAKALHTVDRSSEIRHWLHIYYVLRNRFLFVRRYHKQQQLRLFIFWTWQSLRPLLQALWQRDWLRARAIFLACADGWRGRFGGQNARLSRGQLS